MRWSAEVRRKAVVLFEQGYGWATTASEIGVSERIVKDWQYTYRALGKEALLVTVHRHYDYKIKLAAVLDKVEHGLPVSEIMKRHGVRSATQIRTWTKLYREGGPEALRPKKKGRIPNTVRNAKMSDEEKLKARIQELELELEIQKRINALADE